MVTSHHENLRPGSMTPASSGRAFGIAVGLLFTVIALKPLLHRGEVRTWALLVAFVFFGLAAIKPGALEFLNRFWSGAVNTVILFLLFYLVFVPAGFILRRVRKSDPLRLRYDTRRSSYWLDREEMNQSSSSMKYQF